MDEMQDLMDDSNDIQEVMSRSFMTPDDIDECDLESGKKIHSYFYRYPINLNLFSSSFRTRCSRRGDGD